MKSTFVVDLEEMSRTDDIGIVLLCGAPPVAAPLLDAVGVRHVAPRVWVMPDQPAAGELRRTFAGVLGLIEVGLIARIDPSPRTPTPEPS